MTPERPSTPPPADPLVQLYREATAKDGGPAKAARERVLVYAEAQARQRHARPAAANDARWLRQALAGIAAIGVVGILVLQHGQQADTESHGDMPAAESAAPAAEAPAARPPAAAAPAANERARSTAPMARPHAAPSASKAVTQDCSATDAQAQQAKRANADGTRPHEEHEDHDCAPPTDGTERQPPDRRPPGQ